MAAAAAALVFIERELLKMVSAQARPELLHALKQCSTAILGSGRTQSQPRPLTTT